MFALHQQLQKDCEIVGDLPLSTLLLMNDANYLWFVLVPRCESACEWYGLPATDQHQLLQEVNGLAEYIQQQTGAKKMNIGALGNIVPQLHVHVIARFEHDAAWPSPVWGKVPVKPYADAVSLAAAVGMGKKFIHQFMSASNG